MFQQIFKGLELIKKYSPNERFISVDDKTLYAGDDLLFESMTKEDRAIMEQLGWTIINHTWAIWL